MEQTKPQHQAQSIPLRGKEDLSNRTGAANKPSESTTGDSGFPEGMQPPVTGTAPEAQEYNENDNAPLSCQNRSSIDSKRSGSPREEFLDNLFEENKPFNIRSPATSTGSQGGGTNSSQSTKTPPSSVPTTAEGFQATASQNKRKWRNDDDEEWNRPHRPRKERPDPSDNFEQEGRRGRRLACHFHIFDKQKYCKNQRTGKKYETCSGPGWPSMHHLKSVRYRSQLARNLFNDVSRQHLANSASSVHKKIRCPHCLQAFKTAGAVLKHQDASPPQCMPGFEGSALYNEDDIDKSTWGKIEDEITRQGFERLSHSEQGEINLWVLNNLDHDTQNLQTELRKWELRKWNMTWRTLFPDHTIPACPCKCSNFWSYKSLIRLQVYDDDAFMSLTNTELLVEAFKDTVEFGLEIGEIEGIDDETLDKLMEMLRVAVSIASSSSQQQRDMLRQRLLSSTLRPGLSTSAVASNEGVRSGNVLQEQPDVQADLPVHDFAPMGQQQQVVESHNPTGTASAMDIRFCTQNQSQQAVLGKHLTTAAFVNGQSFSGAAWDQVVEWNADAEWDKLFQSLDDLPLE
jgi:hypothetical protein